MTGSDGKRLIALETNNARLTPLLATQSSEMSCEKSGDVPARRKLVRHRIGHGLNAHRSLSTVAMSASADRDLKRPHRNVERHVRIVGLA